MEGAKEDGSKMEDTEASGIETDVTEETYIPVTDADTETVYAKMEPDGKLAAFLAAYYQYRTNICRKPAIIMIHLI